MYSDLLTESVFGGEKMTVVLQMGLFSYEF